MENDNNSRVESSARRARTNTNSRNPLAASPTPPRSSQRKRKGKGKSTEVSEEFFDVKEIVDEKIVNGKILYLIDWEDDKITGKKYPKSWASFHTLCAESPPNRNASLTLISI